MKKFHISLSLGMNTMVLRHSLCDGSMISSSNTAYTYSLMTSCIRQGRGPVSSQITIPGSGWMVW